MTPPRLLYLLTDDRYFVSHRLPMARAAKAAGFEVHVATRVKGFRAAIEAEGFHLHDLPWEKLKRSPLDIIRDVWAIRRLYGALRPDIVHHVALAPVILGGLAATGLQLASVNTIAGLGSGFIGRGLKGKLVKTALVFALRTMLRRQHAVTVVQNDDDRAALLSIGVPDQAITLIPGSGVDTELLRPLPEPEGPITVGITARMIEDKGIRPLVKAQSMLREKGLDIRLLLAGDYDPANRTAIALPDLEGFSRLPGVTWLGHIEDVEGFWAKCHIAALPSRREGLPKSLLEASALGRPLIATDVPGCRDVALDGETGLLVPVDDAESLAKAIETLATDEALRRRLGDAGRRLVEQRFSSTAIGAQTAALYRSLAEWPVADPAFAV